MSTTPSYLPEIRYNKTFFESMARILGRRVHAEEEEMVKLIQYCIDASEEGTTEKVTHEIEAATLGSGNELQVYFISYNTDTVSYTHLTLPTILLV